MLVRLSKKEVNMTKYREEPPQYVDQLGRERLLYGFIWVKSEVRTGEWERGYLRPWRGLATEAGRTL